MASLIPDFVEQARLASAEVERFVSREDAYIYLRGRLPRPGEAGRGRLLLSPALHAEAVREGLPDCPPTLPPGELWAEAGIVEADYGIAETGTLVRFDRGDAIKGVWTLPDACYCFLDARRIRPDLESIAESMAEYLARTDFPSPQVSLVTGPSRTADIECQLTIGVHGPGRLVILLIQGR
jgi:L-lactate dehydrogenase complex protein LldG